jgi:hypothetical protein
MVNRRAEGAVCAPGLFAATRFRDCAEADDGSAVQAKKEKQALDINMKCFDIDQLQREGPATAIEGYGESADQPPPKATAVRRRNAKAEASAETEAGHTDSSPQHV